MTFIKQKLFLSAVLLLLGQSSCAPILKSPNSEEAIAFFATRYPEVEFNPSLKLQLRSVSSELQESGILSIWVTNDMSESIVISLPDGVGVYAFVQGHWVEINNKMQYLTEEGGLRIYPQNDTGLQDQASIKVSPDLSYIEEETLIRVVIIAMVVSGRDTPLEYVGSYLDLMPEAEH